MVGVDDHSDYPEDAIVGLPRVGPDLQVDPEAIARLEPDLVLASLTVPGHEKVIDSLEKARLPYWASAPESLEAVYNDIIDIAERLNVPSRGTALVEEMRRQFKPVERQDVSPSIAVQWWPKPPIIAARKSWVHDMIQMAGGLNILEELEQTSAPLEFEEFAELNPDIIVMSWCGVKEEKYRSTVISDNPLLSSVSAVKHQRIVSVSEAFLGRPSTRLVEGYRLLKEAVSRFYD